MLATETLLGTIDLPSYVPMIAERIGEAEVARVGREIDVARKQYVNKKNDLNRELRTAETLSEVSNRIRALPGISCGS